MDKTEYTPYINRPTRILAILHLSFIFSFLCWAAINPFVGEHLSFKKRVTLYKTVFGHQDLVLNVQEEEAPDLTLKLQRNTGRFERLSEVEQKNLEADFQSLIQQKDRTWAERIRTMGRELAIGIPPFIQAYLLFSLAICFMLLLRLEGANAAAPLLPILLLIHIYFNQTAGIQGETQGEASLYPSEKELVENHVQGELSPNIRQQYEQLMGAWENYLLAKWYPGEASQDPNSRTLQLEQAEFHFSLARLEKLKLEKVQGATDRSQVQGSLFLQCICLSWSLFFAWFVNRAGATDLEPID